MTTRMLAVDLRVPGPTLDPAFGRTRAVIAALFAAVCVASVMTASARTDRGAAATLPLPGEKSGAPSVVPVSSRAALGNPASAEMEALSTAVARKYRIAPEATRGLVATAYREGGRIGLDPLLILAVIAIESRFNPIAESDGGAKGLMQVIPGYHPQHVAAAGGDSMLEPHANIRLGALVLKECIRRGGGEIAGLQLYNGSSDDATNAYAAKVRGEKLRFEQVVQRLRSRARA